MPIFTLRQIACHQLRNVARPKLALNSFGMSAVRSLSGPKRTKIEEGKIDRMTPNGPQPSRIAAVQDAPFNPKEEIQQNSLAASLNLY